LCYELAEKVYLEGNRSLKELIKTDFVEHLELNHNRWAWKLLPKTLKNLYLDFYGLTPQEQLERDRIFEDESGI
jgi:hypothetical protein